MFHNTECYCHHFDTLNIICILLNVMFGTSIVYCVVFVLGTGTVSDVFVVILYLYSACFS